MDSEPDHDAPPPGSLVPVVPELPPPGGRESPPHLSGPVHFADRTPERRRRREDLIDVILCLFGIAFAWLFGIFAHSTTQGVTEDVLRVSVVRELLLLPITTIEGLVVLIAPVSIVVVLALRRRLMTIVECAVTGVATAVGGWVIVLALRQLPDAWTTPLRVVQESGGESQVALNIVLMTLAAMFTVAGESSDMRVVNYSWWGLWVILFLGVLRGSMSLPGALISLLIGRAAGSLARWLTGFQDTRAPGRDIVASLLSIGIVPTQVVRTDLDTSEAPLTTWIIEERPSSPSGASGGEDGVGDGSGDGDEGDSPAGRDGADPASDGSPRPLRQRPATDVDSAEYTVNRRPTDDDARRYQVWDQAGRLLDVIVVDPGREVVGTVQEIWSNLRLRGISRWISPSLKANAERAMLTALSALRAGVRVPEPIGLAMAGTSVVRADEALPPISPLRDAPPEALTDDVLDQAWRQLLLAHSRGVAHRQISFDSLVIDQVGAVWLVDWEQGEVASSELTRRIDLAQLLVHLSVCVGDDRALASARRALSEAELRAVAPLIQNAILPASVNAAVRRTEIVSDLRDAVVGDETSRAAQPLSIQRFAPRTVITSIILVIALVVVFGTINFEDLRSAVTSANPIWFLIAFLLGALTWLGGAIPLQALSSERFRLFEVVMAQVAASVVTIVAPAGIGPAAINLRFLTKKKVPTPLAVATVTMQQVSQFLVSVFLLIVIMLFTGNSLAVSVPYSAVLAVAGVLMLAICAVLFVPALRRWAWERLEPIWKQIYPRLLWIVGQPRRLLLVLAGNIIQNIGFIGAFWASLQAFGGDLDPTTLAITFLVSNSLGSVIPSPGGIGPVEAALWGGLTVAGVPSSIALSTAVLYRLITFYGRVPFGYAALRYMQNRNLI